MSARSLIASVLVALFTAPLLAQDHSVPDVANGKFQFVGEINANNVYVRSGPSDNYYPTVKLDKGAQVVAVGEKFEWLKIIPPEGSFSYVAKVHVERRGNGSVGRVTRGDLLVKAGSAINAMKTAVQTKLDENTDVTILGEQDEYFKIQPPKDAYLYVHKQFVNLVKPADGAGKAVKPELTQQDTAKEPGQAKLPAELQSEGVSEIPATTQPTEVVAATTQPVDSAVAEQAFDQAESDFLTASKQPLDQRPLSDLLSRYRELSRNEALPGSMKRIAEHRARTLQIQAEAQAELVKARKADEEASQKRVALKAEGEELQQRIQQEQVKVFTAVGTLRTSSLQAGREVLYRLTDPATGRTLVYVRSNDAKLVQSLGTFIGVKGEVINDQQMNIKVINPTAFEPVDPDQVTRKVAAQIMPPSLLPKPSASAGE